MAIQSQVFNTGIENKTFVATKHIADKNHVSVFLRDVETSNWELSPIDDYELINNSVIFKEPIATSNYDSVELRIADEEDELLAPLSDFTIVAQNIVSINNTSDNIDAINTVSDDIGSIIDVSNNVASINTVGNNIANVNKVGNNIDNVNTVANQDANITSIATEVVPNMDEILLADDNAIIATAKASEASQSALNASVSEINALSSENNASISEENALASENKAYKWAEENEDVPVEVGEFSAKHWAIKAQELVSDGIIDDTAPSTLKTYSSSKIESELDIKVDKVTGSSLVPDTKVTDYDNHIIDISNPHSVTKTQVGLSNVDNTSDLDKPISTSQQNALDLKSDDNTVVKLTGDQTIDDIKTFNSSPIVPEPINGTDAVNKDYVDNNSGGIDDTIISTESAWSSQKIVDTFNEGTTGAYGVQWNQETDEYELLGATNRTQIQSQMRRCVLHNDASSTATVGDTSLSGTVNYYLDANDSTLKEDGVTASVLDGTDGNVMVEIPKFYYKHELNGSDHQWWVSPTMETGFSLHPAFLREGTERDYRYYRAYKGYDSGGTLLSRSGVTPTRSQTIATFRTQAAANGIGWSQNDYNLMFAVQLLFLTEYGTLNTQATLGNGNDTGDNYGLTTGQSNIIGNGSSGSLNNNMWMSYRGIENWYADIWEFVDGINIRDYEVFLNSNPSTFASDVFTGDYVSTGTFLVAGTSNSFVKELANTSQGFFPSVLGGSSSTYLTDAFWSATGNRILVFGGNANLGASGGGFCLAAHFASSAMTVTIGAGVSF